MKQVAFVVLLSGISIAAANAQQNGKGSFCEAYAQENYQVSYAPFIAFLARTSNNVLGKPGHSYVALGAELDNGLKCYDTIMGYYPKADGAFEQVKAAASKVSGSIEAKLPDISWKVAFHVRVDDAKRQAAVNVINKWMDSDPKYNLFANGGKNCSSFASEVAKAIGIKVPPSPGTTFPIDFMTKLRDLNQ